MKSRLILLAVALVVGSGLAEAAKPGALDKSFSGNGTLMRKTSTSLDAGYDVAVMGNGKIVVVDGKIVAAGMDDSADGNMVIVRFRASGGLDRAFGNGGVIRPPFPLSSEGYGVDPRGGKIVVAGSAQDPPRTDEDEDLAVVRLHQ